MDKNIDMHMHTYYSADGEYSPSELVKMCVDAGITTMAISDHNGVSGVEEGILAANELGINFIPAIELDGIYKDMEFHILGYDIDYTSKDFYDSEQNVRKQCVRYSKELESKINVLGFEVDEEAMKVHLGDSRWPELWTGEDICAVLLQDKRYVENEILAPYRLGGSRSDNPWLNFYWDYCSQGKPCYAYIEYPPIQEVLDMIHKNGGYAVIAHPAKNLGDNFDLIDEIIPLGIDGIEVYSSYHDAKDTKWFHDKAIEKGLKITRGSDFHGRTKPAIKLVEIWD